MHSAKKSTFVSLGQEHQGSLLLSADTWFILNVARFLFRITVHMLGTIMEISRTNSLGTSEQVLTTERVWRFSVLALAAVGTLHVLKLGGCCWRERH